MERNQAVIYKGPWKQVHDDDGHALRRGQRMAVCDKTYRLMTDPAGAYAGQVIGVEPLSGVPPDQAQPFDCRRSAVRDPRQTKGVDYRVTRDGPGGACCEPGGSCC